MRTALLIAGLLIAFASLPASAQDEEADERMSQRERVSYAVGYTLGQRISASGKQITPAQVAAGIREGNQGGDRSPEDTTPGFRLGQMIVARGLNVSPSVVAEAMKDALDGNVALLDSESRSAALAEATGGPYAKVETEVDAKVDGRVNEAATERVNSRAGYGAWSTPGATAGRGVTGGSGQSALQQGSDIRVSRSGRIEAGVNTQQINAGVAGTAVNTAEVDAFAPVPAGQGQ